MKVSFNNRDKLDREVLFDAITPGNDFFTYTIDGVSFIGRSSDKFIIRRSYINSRIWAFSSLREFYRLAHQYYDVDDSRQKYFFDIGANIGTTCISFYKKFDQNLKIAAFEPVGENYRLLRANALLNNMPEDTYEFVNKALGARSARARYNFKDFNTGAANIEYVKSDSIAGNEENITDVSTLDEYVEDRNINYYDIKYIWIDTEGFEPEVIKGADNILSSVDIPVFMEFTPIFFRKRANTETSEFVELLSKYYSKYIVVGIDGVHDIRELIGVPEKIKNVTNQFDIFLIK